MNPFIVSSPPSEIQVQNVDDSVKLHCSARGLPLPRVKWFKDGSVISTTAHQENDLTKSEVVIHRFKPSYAGIYSCLFENDKNGTAEANTSLSMCTVDVFLFCYCQWKTSPFSIRFARNTHFTKLSFCYREVVLENQRQYKISSENQWQLYKQCSLDITQCNNLFSILCGGYNDDDVRRSLEGFEITLSEQLFTVQIICMFSFSKSVKAYCS